MSFGCNSLSIKCDYFQIKPQFGAHFQLLDLITALCVWKLFPSAGALFQSDQKISKLKPTVRSNQNLRD